MAHKTSETNCIVRLVPLDLNRSQEIQCEALRREAGRAWTDMLKAHIASRSGQWLTADDLMRDFKARYALHSQSVQALAQKLEANIDTARKLRQNGDTEARYPYKEKPYQTVTWKDQGLRVRDRQLILSNGRGRDSLRVVLPAEYQSANIRKAELLWRANHYELALTIDTGTVNPSLLRRVKTAGVDLGEINIAAVVSDEGAGMVITGRYLRSVKRLRNKRHAAYTRKMANCKPSSRRMKRLRTRKAQASAKFYRQQRDILHKASRKVVEFCKQENVAKIAIGDVRDIADRTDKGRKQNQRMSQWPHGQFVQYVSYKGRVYGIATDYQREDYSTRTCSGCGRVRSSSPRGRVFTCPGCGVVVSRDGNGGANICSRARYGAYGKVQIKRLTYLRATVVAPRHGPKLLA